MLLIAAVFRDLIFLWHHRGNSLEWRHNECDGVLISSLTIVYPTVYSDANPKKQKKTHQSSAWLAFVRGIHSIKWEYYS